MLVWCNPILHLFRQIIYPRCKGVDHFKRKISEDLLLGRSYGVILQNDHGISLNDWVRPGILLTASPIKKPSKLNAMPACIFHYPLISVFLGFRTDDTNYIAENITYEGYVVEKEELLTFIKENNITIKDSHLI